MRKSYWVVMFGLVLLVAASPAFAESETPRFQKVSLPPEGGGLYNSSSLVPTDVGPVERPHSSPGPIGKPLSSAQPATRNVGGSPFDSGETVRLGGAIPVPRGVVGSLDTVTSTDRRLKKLIGKLEG